MYYIGFDLGDGESCLTWFDGSGKMPVPVPIPITQSESFPTAVAVMRDTGDIVIGRSAVSAAPTIQDLRVCFKRNFKSGDGDVYESYRRFITGVMNQLRKADLPFCVDDPAQCRFVIGQPADWDRDTLTRYRNLLEQCGIRDPWLVSESRAALVYVNTARFMEAYDPASSSTLVCDFGSSTLDFAYCENGDSTNVKVFGDPHLGGGLMDEQIVLESIRRMEDRKQRAAAEELIRSRPDILARLMMTARTIKEQYFSDGDAAPLALRVPLFHPEVPALTVAIDARILEAVIMYPQPLLDNNSIYQQLRSQFARALAITRQAPPQVVVLTGGASRMQFFRDICAETFQRTSPTIVSSDTPEKDIACGLALDGGYQEKLMTLRAELQHFADGQTVENIVAEAMPELLHSVAERTMDALLKNDPARPGAIRQAFRDWKEADAARSLNDLTVMIQDTVRDYSHGSEFSALIEAAVSDWMTQVLASVQRHLDDICYRVGVSPAHAQLRTLKITEAIDIAGTTFEPGMTIINILDAIITAVTATIVGVLCGGAGTALICTGPAGVLIGVLLVGALRLLFRNQAREAVMSIRWAGPIRSAIPERSIFNEEAVSKMSRDFEEKLARQSELDAHIRSTLAAYIDSVILAISCQTRV